VLFNRKVERIQMTMCARHAASQSVTCYIEHRASCPRAYPPPLGPAKTFRDRVNLGDCLIAEAESTSPMEATVSFTTLYNHYRDYTPSAHAPPFARIDSIKRLVVERLKTAVRNR
jgi:hypothetical protein